jgi:hypothetical protein
VAKTKDGRVLLNDVPMEFMQQFCDVMNHRGMAGKISIIPAPAGKGDIVNGITGRGMEELREWIKIANDRLSSHFEFCPECLTHTFALDLKTGKYTNKDEETWSFEQDRSALTPYLEYALTLLKKACIDATGFTSPWSFGSKVEEEYIAAMVGAQKTVYGRKLSWYFLHSKHPDGRPWIAFDDGDSCLVSIPGTIHDHIWETIDTPRDDEVFVSSVADHYLTLDGSEGDIPKVLEAGGYPAIVTHWQSLFSNGLGTGLKILDEVARRVNQHLPDKVEWKSCMEIARMTAGR